MYKEKRENTTIIVPDGDSLDNVWLEVEKEIRQKNLISTDVTVAPSPTGPRFVIPDTQFGQTENILEAYRKSKKVG